MTSLTVVEQSLTDAIARAALPVTLRVEEAEEDLDAQISFKNAQNQILPFHLQVGLDQDGLYVILQREFQDERTHCAIEALGTYEEGDIDAAIDHAVRLLPAFLAA